MGVDYSAMLIFGLPSKEVPEMLDNSEGDYAFYYKGLDRASPYFGSPSEDWIIGVNVECTMDYCAKLLDLNEVILDVCEARKKFFEITGKEGELFLSPHGS